MTRLTFLVNQQYNVSVDEVLFSRYWEIFALRCFYQLLAEHDMMDWKSLPTVDTRINSTLLFMPFPEPGDKPAIDGAVRDNYVPLYQAPAAASTNEIMNRRLLGHGYGPSAYGAFIMENSPQLFSYFEQTMNNVAQEWWQAEGESLVRS